MLKNIFSGLVVKKSVFVGLIVLFPIFVILFVLTMAINFLTPVWQPVFEFFGVDRYTKWGFGLEKLLLSFLFLYVCGRVLISERVRRGCLGKIIRSVPLLGFFYKIAVAVVYSLEDLKSFPVVMIEQFDGNYTFAIGVGIQKQRQHTKAGVKVRRLLRIYSPDFPFFFNGRGGIVEFRKAHRVLNPFSECISLFTTANIAAPEWLDTKPWSEEFSEELEQLSDGATLKISNDVYHLRDLKNFLKQIFEKLLFARKGRGE